jgi:hypothetical protein
VKFECLLTSNELIQVLIQWPFKIAVVLSVFCTAPSSSEVMNE